MVDNPIELLKFQVCYTTHHLFMQCAHHVVLQKLNEFSIMEVWQPSLFLNEIPVHKMTNCSTGCRRAWFLYIYASGEIISDTICFIIHIRHVGEFPQQINRLQNWFTPKAKKNSMIYQISFNKTSDLRDHDLYRTGGRLNKKDGLTRYGDSHVKDKTS